MMPLRAAALSDSWPVGWRRLRFTLLSIRHVEMDSLVDGVEQPVFRALSGQLVPVAAGHHVIEQDLVPRDALLGLALGVVTLAVALRWAGVSPRVRRRSRRTGT